MLGKVKWTTVIFGLCNISAMCIEMTKTYDIMIGLRQLLCMCKAEKTQLNDSVPIGGFCVQSSKNCCRQSTKDRNLTVALFERHIINTNKS